MEGARGSQVLQEDPVSRGCLEVERDVGAGFSPEGLEVQRGGGATEGGGIPVTPFRNRGGRSFKSIHVLVARQRIKDQSVIASYFFVKSNCLPQKIVAFYGKIYFYFIFKLFIEDN